MSSNSERPDQMARVDHLLGEVLAKTASLAGLPAEDPELLEEIGSELRRIERALAILRRELLRGASAMRNRHPSRLYTPHVRPFVRYAIGDISLLHDVADFLGSSPAANSGDMRMWDLRKLASEMSQVRCVQVGPEEVHLLRDTAGYLDLFHGTAEMAEGLRMLARRLVEDCG